MKNDRCLSQLTLCSIGLLLVAAQGGGCIGLSPNAQNQDAQAPVVEQVPANQDGEPEEGNDADCLERCAEAGADEEACQRRCGGGAEANDCPRACRERARGAHEGCVEDGHAPEDCRTRAGEMTRECVENSCEGDGREEDCRADCRERAATLYEECVDGGNDPDACRQRAGRAFQACTNRACGEGEHDGEDDGDDANECEERCRERAVAAVENCIEEGGERCACRERYQKLSKVVFNGSVLTRKKVTETS